ncbi:polycystic kidney disease and receptor for egg jelly-related protein-like [Trichosurus vulpecula]|uniref:polycystic kidney disease and receptor for egg jelly-related protein-like n=1 Tax=Trichosurus vulpecula TaxID=9337 RepID=UPI00186ACD89|nr:polycystic kidney disease and receptor for egg jelly-related protein-like [Trichosurus vulpecula]
MFRVGALAPFLQLLLLLPPPPLPRRYSSAAPAPSPPARPAPRQSLHPCLQALLFPSRGPHQSSNLTLTPHRESYLGFPLGPAPEPDRSPDPVASSGRGSKWDLALGLQLAPMPRLGSGCKGALFPYQVPQLKPKSGSSSIPGRPAEAALLHILSASSPPLSQRLSGALHLSWRLQSIGSRLTFRLYQPRECGLCQVWKVTCNAYLEARGISCIPGNTRGRGTPSWTLAHLVLPGRGWDWRACRVIGQSMEGDLHLVNSTLGIRVRGSALSLNLRQAQTGSYGPGIYYSRAPPGRGSAQKAQSHLFFYQQQGLSWLFALDFLGSRCDRLSVHLYLSPKGAAFFGTRPNKDLEVHFFNITPLGPRGLIYLVWFIPLQHPLLHLQWTFHLQFPGASLRHNRTYTYQDRLPSASRFIPRSVLPFHPDAYAGFAEKAHCPTSSLEPAVLEASLDTYGSKVLKSPVACVQNPCFIHEVRIKEGPSLTMSGRYPLTLNTAVKVNCSIPHNVTRDWNFYPILNVNTTPDWNRPLRTWWIRQMKRFSFFQIPERVLPQGLYLVNFSVTVTTAEKEMKASDFLFLSISKSQLVAVIGGGYNRRVAFNESWTLDGSASSDPDSHDLSQGLDYRWYCTTNRSHFESVIVPDSTRDTCLPWLPDLRWIQESGPVHTVLPGTLRGNQVYYFRLVVQKDDRKSFNDQRITVTAGPPPAMSFSCIENCENNLIITDRFSLSGKCTDCGSAPVDYLWSLLSILGHEIPFDWAHKTSTGRANPYLSIKASAFKGFRDQFCFISLRVSNWGGGFSVSNHSFYINSPPHVGQCSIHPDKGTALVTKFVVQCSDFRDYNLPLSFKIIASNFWDVDDISSLDHNTLGAVMYLGAQPVTPPSFLPIGMPANNYLVIIYAQVYDSLGTFSQVTLYATVNSPLDRDSPNTVLGHLFSLTQNSSGAMLTTLFQQGDFVQAGYLAFLVASVLKDVKPLPELQTNRSELQERLINFCNRLPTNTLVEINQVTVTILELTQEGSGLTAGVQKAATSRLMEMNLALQSYRQREKKFHSEQIEIVSTGISTSLSNIFKTGTHKDTVTETLYVTELLADTVSSIKVPGEVETVISTPNFKMHVNKDEKQNVTEAFLAKKDCQNCFYPTLRKSNVTDVALREGPISTAFYEFKGDPFPWLSQEESPSVDVVGFRMRETKENGDVFEVEPEVVEAFILRKNLKEAVFNLTVGPDKDLLKMTTGVFNFVVNGGYKEVFIHIITEVKVLFKVLIYVGNNITHTLPIASFLAPPDMSPVANESALFDSACKVKVPYLICLSESLLQATARGSVSAKWHISVVLQSPYIVMKPNDKLVRISIFTAQCLNMDGVQQEWGKEDCAVGDGSSWWRVHCICHLKPEPIKETKPSEPWLHGSRIKYLTARMVVIPNSIDLRMDIIRTLPQNPVSLFTVIFIIFTYLVLAFWAMHKDETDKFLREHVIVLPDNDPYDHICYLVTFYTGSRLGAGTRADVFLQLLGTEANSDVHCLSHPDFTTFYRGSTDTFLLTTRSDLGSIRAIRVWHNNEGSRPSWYLSRVKVENIFNRHIWLFLCRSWLSVDALEQAFEVADKTQPLSRKDYFLIHASDLLGTSHLWLSVFASVVTGPFNRLQRLSCCLTILLSTLLCNIMFFNRDEEGEVMPVELKHLRGLMRGIESALVCEPLRMALSALFTYSQKEVAAVPTAHVAPRLHPLMKSDFRNWKERLEMWYYRETALPQTRGQGAPTKKQAPGNNLMLPEAAANAITETKGKPPNSGLQPTAAVSAEQKAATPKPATPAREATDRKDQTFREAGGGSLSSSPSDVGEQGSDKDRKVEGPSSEPPRDRHKQVMLFEARPHFVLHRWCLYVAWLLVIGNAGVSSFFIIMYGLTYGYQKSMQWLLASVYSLCQSIFVIQVAKILLTSGIKASRAKYCKNISWTTRYHYIEIRLQGVNLDADETRELHHEIVRVRGTRMYQPLVEDEIRIFRRRTRIKKRAIVFLRNIVIHFVFLALLLCITSLARHSHSFHHNQAVRSQFSTNLEKVRELNDTFKWLTTVLLPLVHNRQHPTFLSNSWSRILGLPRMRQVRSKSIRKSCFLSGTAANRLMKKGIRCQHQYSWLMEDRKNYGRFWTTPADSSVDSRLVSFTYEPKLNKWAYYSYGLSHTYGIGGYPFYFFPNQQQYNSTIRLQELQESRWLDERTWAVILELATFNSDASLFCTISVVFEVSPLGVINPSLAIHSFSLPLFHGRSQLELYLYGAATVFLVVYLVEEVIIIHKEKKNYVRNGFNVISFGIKSMFLFLVLLLYIQFRMAKKILAFYLKNPDNFIPFHAISHVDQVLRIALGFLVFLTILKTLMYSRFFYDVRLAQRAILAALPGIFHMAFLVGVYIFVYVVFGYLVFGQHQWHYSSIIHSTQTIFSYCVSAFEDTAFLNKEVLGGLFLSSFMLVMICVLINLFQAVILSAYEEMKQLVYEEPAAEVEAATYLFHKVRNLFRFLTCRAPAQEEPAYFTDILYGHPENKSYQYLGLKTRNINGKRMTYVVV